MSTFAARLSAPTAKFPAGGPVTLRFDLTNQSTEDYYVLTWYTPLEGLFSDCLLVTRDGKDVDYDGRLPKRGQPSINEYILVKAGATASVDFDIGVAYQVSIAGNYEVQLNTAIRDFFSANKPKEAEALAGDPTRQTVQQALQGGAVRFTVDGGKKAGPGGGAPRPTEGEASRAESSRGDASRGEGRGPKRSAVGGPQNPLFVGGTQERQDKTRTAHFDGYTLCVNALSGLVNNAAYVEWFGTYDETRFQSVQTVYTKVKSRMESTVFTYDLTGTGCQPNWYAYTHKGDTKIWMCSAFWNAPQNGTDSKAGTVLHEHTHSDAGTDDIAYGQSACRTLASTKPNDAVKNADNYEYYGKG